MLHRSRPFMKRVLSRSSSHRRHPAVLLVFRIVPLVLAIGSVAGCADRSEHVSSAVSSSAASPPASAGTAFVFDPSDWCAGHGVRESQCTRCNPELIPAFKARGDWCDEHRLPESQCARCNPSLRPAGSVDHQPRQASGSSRGISHDIGAAEPGLDEQGHEHALALAGGPGSDRADEGGLSHIDHEGQGHADHDGHGHVDHDGHGHTMADIDPDAFCGEHGVPEIQCAICLPSVGAALQGSFGSVEFGGNVPYRPLVRLASPETARKAGLRAVRAAQASPSLTVEALATLDFDQERFARLTFPASAIVEAVPVDLGQEVRPGDVCVVVRSAEFAGLQARVRAVQARERLAERDFERARSLHADGLVAERDFLGAEQELELARAERAEAERALAAVGGAQETATAREPATSKTPLERHAVRSPIFGVVVGRHALPGQGIDAEEALIEVADMRRLWAQLDLREQDAGLVREGQPVSLQLEAFPGETFFGEIVAVGSQVDPRTRRLRARALIGNLEGRLKANLFGRAFIGVGGNQAQAAIPPESVQRVEDLPVVFVRQADDLFEVRPIAPGRRAGERLEILAGLVPGEEVVTDGAFLLKTQISKGSIGAGCCDIEAVERNR